MVRAFRKVVAIGFLMGGLHPRAECRDVGGASVVHRPDVASVAQ